MSSHKIILSAAALATSTASAGHTIEMTRKKSLREAYEAKKRSPRVVSSGGATVTINEYMEVEWFGPVEIGTPAQTFQVILDTGSSDLWVPANCTSGCGDKPQFNPAKSSTFKKNGTQFQLQYGSGPVSGVRELDTAALGGLSVTNYKFGLANDVSGLQGFTQQKFDGILGFAWPKANRVSDMPWFFNLMQQNKDIEGKYGFLLPGVDGKKGALDLGFANPAHYQGEFTDIPLDLELWWTASVTSMGLKGGSSFGATKYAIFDTGTSALVLPTQDATAFQQAVGATCFGGECEIDCSAQIPDFEVQFGDAKISVPGKNFILKAEGQCALLVSGMDEPGVPGLTILGDTVLRAFYAVFDVENKRMRLAQQKN